jgi:16S rRNA (uracil1498-N3)-methyltransferase
MTLTLEQQHYLGRVLRLGQGDRFVAMDGVGGSWLAELGHSGQAAIVEALTVHTELPLAVTLMIALPKGNGFDEVVRQATELGVACIAPVISDRTLLQPSPQKLDRWRRIAQEAAEQSERQLVPTLLDPIPFSTALPSSTPNSYICVTRQIASPFLDRLLLTQSKSLTVAIGPEGGWTEAEVAQAIAAQFEPVTLGARILRTVTAPIVALSLIAATQERTSQIPPAHH